MSGPMIPGRLQKRFRFVHDSEHSLGDLMQRPANDGQFGRSMGPMEDFYPLSCLQFANLFGDRRLGEVQFLGGGGETTGLSNRVEGAQLGIFHRTFLLSSSKINIFPIIPVERQ